MLFREDDPSLAKVMRNKSELSGHENDADTLRGSWSFGGSAIVEPDSGEYLDPDAPPLDDPQEIANPLRALDESGLYDPDVMRTAEGRAQALQRAAAILREVLEANGVPCKPGDAPTSDDLKRLEEIRGITEEGKMAS